MTRTGHVIARIAIGLSASLFMPSAGEALTAGITAQCNAYVRSVWPQSGVEYERTKEDVFQACALNGGRIP